MYVCMHVLYIFVHITQVANGHLQLDNCRFEESKVIVDHPGTCHFRYCSFNRVHLILNHVNSSLIENCDLKQCTVHVQGFPKERRNWTFEALSRLTDIWDDISVLCGPSEQFRCDFDSTLNTTQSCQASSAFEVNKSEVDSIGVASIDCLSDSPRKSDNDCPSKASVSDASQHSYCSFSSLSENENPVFEDGPTQSVNVAMDLNASGTNSQEPLSRAISISSKSKITVQNLPPLAELERCSSDSPDVSSSYLSSNPSLLQGTGLFEISSYI